MTATILDGKSLAKQIRTKLAAEVVSFLREGGPQPVLAAVLVGHDPASEVYVRHKRRDCQQVGIESQLHRLPETASEDELLALVTRLNEDPRVHGILVQLPVPRQIRTHCVLDAIRPDKDVDAFHPENVGRLLQGRPRFLPCTPHAIQHLLLKGNIPIDGTRVVIVGRSDIVGKPLAGMLMQRDTAANATVTVCHSHTRDLPAVTREADILVVAIGQPKFLTAGMVRPGATVIDVGINRTDDGLVGDVDYQSVAEVAGQISPVPGGVGPLTRTMLLVNTLAATKALQKES